MFFRDNFLSVADVLDSRLKAFDPIDHAGDKGEICEIFVKDFLNDAFPNSFQIFRGGMVVDSTGAKSEQMDIVVCSQNCIKIFSDKGIYPVETVYGVVNVTKDLTKTKLFSQKNGDGGSIRNLESIPRENIEIHGLNTSNEKIFRERFPLKVVFAYEGKILPQWASELNKIVEDDRNRLFSLPDFIVVNKQGMIQKQREGKAKFTDGTSKDTFFHFTSFDDNHAYHAPFIAILYELYKNNCWQYSAFPRYEAYFNKDLSK